MKMTTQNIGAKSLITGDTGLSGSILIKKFESFKYVELYEGDLLKLDTCWDALNLMIYLVEKYIGHHVFDP
jgi:hypothetical protein